MEDKKALSPQIVVLEESVARRIAAGEVIERPASVVRELMDNSIDAGADQLSLYLEQGGVTRIRLVDNGNGMTRRDLELCWLPHATSKIRKVSDLQTVKTLGFRGEALSSISSCSRLEILSYSSEEDNCNRLLIDGGKVRYLEPHRGAKGTIIDVSDLFYSVPARKQFLKRPSTESRL
jgi:DNA mismatch repair protein MutL